MHLKNAINYHYHHLLSFSLVLIFPCGLQSSCMGYLILEPVGGGGVYTTAPSLSVPPVPSTNIVTLNDTSVTPESKRKSLGGTSLTVRDISLGKFHFTVSWLPGTSENHYKVIHSIDQILTLCAMLSKCWEGLQFSDHSFDIKKKIIPSDFEGTANMALIHCYCKCKLHLFLEDTL